MGPAPRQPEPSQTYVFSIAPDFFVISRSNRVVSELDISFVMKQRALSGYSMDVRTFPHPLLVAMLIIFLVFVDR